MDVSGMCGGRSRGAVVVAGLAMSGLLAGLSVVGASAEQPESTCVPTTTHTMAPGVVLLGEPVTETLWARALCPPAAYYLHIAFVLDGSQAQSANAREWTYQFVADVIDELRLEERPLIRVGVVVFGDQSPTSCEPTNDAQRALRCADDVLRPPNHPGDTEDLGLLEAQRVLQRARRLLKGQHDGAREVIVLVSDARCVDIVS